MAKSGIFDIFYYDAYSELKIATTSVGASAQTFKNNLNNLPNIAEYDPSVTMSTIDLSGNPTTDPTLI